MIRIVCSLLVAAALCVAVSNGEALPTGTLGPDGGGQILEVATTAFLDDTASQLDRHDVPSGSPCGRFDCVGDSLRSPSVVTLRQMPEPFALLLLSAGFAILSRGLRRRPTRP